MQSRTRFSVTATQTWCHHGQRQSISGSSRLWRRSCKVLACPIRGRRRKGGCAQPILRRTRRRTSAHDVSLLFSCTIFFFGGKAISAEKGASEPPPHGTKKCLVCAGLCWFVPVCAAVPFFFQPTFAHPQIVTLSFVTSCIKNASGKWPLLSSFTAWPKTVTTAAGTPSNALSPAFLNGGGANKEGGTKMMVGKGGRGMGAKMGPQRR